MAVWATSQIQRPKPIPRETRGLVGDAHHVDHADLAVDAHVPRRTRTRASKADKTGDMASVRSGARGREATPWSGSRPARELVPPKPRGHPVVELTSSLPPRSRALGLAADPRACDFPSLAAAT